ncbi:hypothetical protein ACLKA7_003625 [Drosophila subpalustris]
MSRLHFISHALVDDEVCSSKAEEGAGLQWGSGLKGEGEGCDVEWLPGLHVVPRATIEPSESLFLFLSLSPSPSPIRSRFYLRRESRMQLQAFPRAASLELQLQFQLAACTDSSR